jgi:hypothetical protein
MLLLGRQKLRSTNPIISHRIPEFSRTFLPIILLKLNHKPPKGVENMVLTGEKKRSSNKSEMTINGLIEKIEELGLESIERVVVSEIEGTELLAS